jgi:serine/threonine-protein kinase HipA
VPTDLRVLLGGTDVGTVSQSAGGALRFNYDDEYRRGRDATPLSLSMPLVRATHKNRTVRAYLQGLLPDSPGRIAQLAREHGVSAQNPAALLKHVGRDAPGAVQLLPVTEATDARPATDDYTELSDPEFDDLIADLVVHADTWGRSSGDARWSLPGAQPKVALYRTAAGRWAVPRGLTPSTHILKPAVAPYTQHHLNEWVTMSAARRLGLLVADSDVLTTSRGDHVFVTRRYDREPDGVRTRRLHQEDLCQALSVPPSLKYQVDGGPSIRQLGRLFATLPDAADRRGNAERFFDAIVFAVAVVGTDAHAKNYSLLLSGDRATLAPLYDLGSYAPYARPGVAPASLAMAVEGEYRVDAISATMLRATARSLGLDRDRADARIAVMTVGVTDAVSLAAADAHTTLGPHPFLATMVDSVAAHARTRGWVRSA